MQTDVSNYAPHARAVLEVQLPSVEAYAPRRSQHDIAYEDGRFADREERQLIIKEASRMMHTIWLESVPVRMV